jgi:hypothetical protein
MSQIGGSSAHLAGHIAAAYSFNGEEFTNCCGPLSTHLAQSSPVHEVVSTLRAELGFLETRHLQP